MRSPRRLVITWIATLAVLMASLAPAISHAIGAQSPTSWAEICTSAGDKLVTLEHGSVGKHSLPGSMHLLDHCPYCSLHADAFPVPPAVPALADPILLGDLLPLAFLHAARTLDVWSSAQARAPPLRG